MDTRRDRWMRFSSARSRSTPSSTVLLPPSGLPSRGVQSLLVHLAEVVLDALHVLLSVYAVAAQPGRLGEPARPVGPVDAVDRHARRPGQAGGQDAVDCHEITSCK